MMSATARSCTARFAAALVIPALLGFAPLQAQASPEDGLSWFPRVAGPGDQRWLVHLNHCSDTAGVISDSIALTLVDADAGRFRLAYDADTLLCGTPPPPALMAIPIPDAIDGVPVLLIDVERNHLSTSARSASWTMQVPARVAVPPSIVGTWFAPEHAKQGLLVTLTQRAEAAVSWNTYAADGTPRWLSGVAQTQPEDSTFSVALSDPGEGRFADAADTPSASTSWGELEIEYLGCGELQASWTPDASTGLEAGTATMQQLTAPYSDPCNLGEWATSQGYVLLPIGSGARP